MYIYIIICIMTYVIICIMEDDLQLYIIYIIVFCAYSSLPESFFDSEHEFIFDSAEYTDFNKNKNQHVLK